MSTDATRAAPLSIGTHTQATDPTLLPSPKGLPDSDLANHLGTSDGRTYVVSSVAGTDLTKVVVSVTWTD